MTRQELEYRAGELLLTGLVLLVGDKVRRTASAALKETRPWFEVNSFSFR